MQNQRNRTRPEVIDTILHSMGEGVTKTRIMYNSYMSYDALKEYLGLMEQAGLIDHDETHAFRVTEKGLYYMEIYDKVRQQLLTDEERKSNLRQRSKFEKEILTA